MDTAIDTCAAMDEGYVCGRHVDSIDRLGMSCRIGRQYMHQEQSGEQANTLFSRISYHIVQA